MPHSVKLSPMGIWLTILLLPSMYAGIEWLSKEMVGSGSQVLTVRVEISDQQGKEARMTHEVLDSS